MPVHRGLEDDLATGPAFDKPPEVLRNGVIDAALAEHRALEIQRAINAVSLVVIDANEAWIERDWGRTGFHPTIYTIGFIRLS